MLDLAPDGKRCVVLMAAERPEDRGMRGMLNHVMIMVNFFAKVRRRVAGRK